MTATDSLPAVTVEVAFRTDPNVTVPEWEDVSEYVRGLTMKRGRQRELEQVQAGVCEVKLDNSDRRFDPSYSYSPFYPYVLPMRRIRIHATWNSVDYCIFSGYVERWPMVWDGPRTGTVTVVGVDAFAPLAIASITGTFAEAATGTRIAEVLTAAAWPSSTPQAGGYWTLGTSQLDTTTILSYGSPTTSIDEGQSDVQEAVFDTDNPQSALAHILEVAQAERGVFFIDCDGNAVFQDRRARYGQTSAVTFTDGSQSSSRLPYQMDMQPEFDVERVFNEVIVTRTGGTAQTAVDEASRERFFRRTLPLTPPLTTDADAEQRAHYELHLRSAPQLEFTRLSLKPQAHTASWPYALGLELGDLVTVERTPDSTTAITAETTVRDCFVEAIQHQASPGEWVTSFQLSPADRYSDLFTLGTSELDSAVLAY